MFTKYVKQVNDTKVLLMYLLLNNYDISRIKCLEETEEDRLFGLKIKKVYGITDEYVDIRKIEEEIEQIQNPLICSLQSYEYYANSPIIYAYSAAIDSKPLYINDLNVVSRIMVITDKCIISSNKAQPLADTNNCGFMFFFDYVLKSETHIGKWHLTYSDKIFNVFYQSENNGKVYEELLYSAIEIDKTSTYKMVLYIIKKVVPFIDDWTSDNFAYESYELVVRNE